MQPSLLPLQHHSPRALQHRRRSAAPAEDQFALFQFSPEGTLLLPEPLEPGASSVAALVLAPRNYRITAADRLGQGSLRQKAEDNLRAIRLLARLGAEGRPASPEE
jgi:hypothetical protein